MSVGHSHYTSLFKILFVTNDHFDLEGVRSEVVEVNTKWKDYRSKQSSASVHVKISAVGADGTQVLG